MSTTTKLRAKNLNVTMTLATAKLTPKVVSVNSFAFVVRSPTWRMTIDEAS